MRRVAFSGWSSSRRRVSADDSSGVSGVGALGMRFSFDGSLKYM
jgi:hypothetical protein